MGVAAVSIKKLADDTPFFLVWAGAMSTLVIWMAKPVDQGIIRDRAGWVVDREGTVEVRPPGEFMWYQATKEAPLRPYEVIATGPGSRATVELAGGIKIQLPEKTQVKILPSDAHRGSEVTLLNGSLKILPSAKGAADLANQSLRQKQAGTLRVRTSQQTLRVAGSQSGVAIQKGTQLQIQTASPESIVIETNQRSQRLPVADAQRGGDVARGTAARQPVQIKLQAESGLYLQDNSHVVQFSDTRTSPAAGGSLAGSASTPATSTEPAPTGASLLLSSQTGSNQKNLVGEAGAGVKQELQGSRGVLDSAMALGVFKGAALVDEPRSPVSGKQDLRPKKTVAAEPKQEQKVLLTSLENQLKLSQAQAGPDSLSSSPQSSLPELQTKGVGIVVPGQPPKSPSKSSMKPLKALKLPPPPPVVQWTAPAVFPGLIPVEKFYWTRFPLSQLPGTNLVLEVDPATLEPPLKAPWQSVIKITDEDSGKTVERFSRITNQGVVIDPSLLRAALPIFPPSVSQSSEATSSPESFPEYVRMKIEVGIHGPLGKHNKMATTQASLTLRTLATASPSTLYLDDWSTPSPVPSPASWIPSRTGSSLRALHLYQPDILTTLGIYLEGSAFTLKPLVQKPGPFLTYGIRQAQFVMGASDEKDREFMVEKFDALGLDMVFEGEAKWYLGTGTIENFKSLLSKKADIYYARRGQTFKLDKFLFSSHATALEFIKSFNPHFFDRKVKILKQK